MGLEIYQTTNKMVLSNLSCAPANGPTRFEEFPVKKMRSRLRQPMNTAPLETTVEAALARSRDLFIQALILDGDVSSPDSAAALADDLLAEQAAYF